MWSQRYESLNMSSQPLFELLNTPSMLAQSAQVNIIKVSSDNKLTLLCLSDEKIKPERATLCASETTGARWWRLLSAGVSWIDFEEERDEGIEDEVEDEVLSGTWSSLGGFLSSLLWFSPSIPLSTLRSCTSQYWTAAGSINNFVVRAFSPAPHIHLILYRRLVYPSKPLRSTTSSKAKWKLPSTHAHRHSYSYEMREKILLASLLTLIWLSLITADGGWSAGEHEKKDWAWKACCAVSVDGKRFQLIWALWRKRAYREEKRLNRFHVIFLYSSACSKATRRTLHKVATLAPGGR
jgi:hypothetical protein